MPLTILESGAQELNCTDSLEEFCAFGRRWKLEPNITRRILILGMRVRRDLGFRLWILSGGRSSEEQARLLRLWEAGDPRVVHRPARGSLHLVGAAADIGTDFTLSAGQWEIVGTMAETLRLQWGGRFPDPDNNHFQVPLSHTTVEEESWRPCGDCGFPPLRGPVFEEGRGSLTEHLG